MTDRRGITLYMHMHQPWRVRDYSVFDTALNHDYFSASDGSDRDNQTVFHKVADKSYRPMNGLLEHLLNSQPDFKFSLSLSGVWLEQAEQWTPDLIEQLQRMINTGRVEIVGETYHHSLAFFYSRDEFDRQVAMHREIIQRLFGVTPRAFRNTELAYNDDLAAWAENAGYDVVLAEGWDPILEWRSPNYVYRPAGRDRLRLLLKNYRLSDDIAFRFSNKTWVDYPLTAAKYRRWLDAGFSDGASTINLFMDFETFGEHQWQDTGIFSFFEDFVNDWLNDNTFYTVSEAAQSAEPAGDISMPDTVTWADSERDLTAWLGNSLQTEAMRYLYAIENDVLRSDDLDLINDWRRLQASDHAYYMSTKWHDDGNVHAYFSPYESPYDAFLYYMNTLRDMRYRLMRANPVRGGE